jgi:protein phosphatase
MIQLLRIAAITNIGQHRRRNEDSMLVGTKIYAGTSMDMPQVFDTQSLPVILAVADGIGGSVAGDIASSEVMLCLARPPCPDGEEKLTERILQSAASLQNIVRKNPALDGMGTTLAGVLCLKKDLIIFSCGDSRVYLGSPHHRLTQMTRDHSVIQEMIEAGTLTEQKARSHPLGHIITSSLSGGKHRLPPDIRISKTDAMPGSRLIICTDGVWDYGGEEFIEAARSGDPETAAFNILHICYQAGAPDNITLIIADLQ